MNRLLHASLFAATFVCTLAVSATAHADTCTSDSDCTPLESCQIVGTSGCPTPTPCDPNADPSTCEPPHPCDPIAVYGCVTVSTTCADDRACSGTDRCILQTVTVCDGGSAPCDPNAADCTTSPPANCNDELQGSCVPQYEAPCTVDADCGDGFTCIDDVSTTCTGSACAPDDANCTPDPGTCTDTPLGTQSCRVNDIPCTTTADCPGVLTCTSFAGPVGPPCSVDSDGNTTCPGDNTPPELRCLPPDVLSANTGGPTVEPTVGGTDNTSGTGTPTADHPPTSTHPRDATFGCSQSSASGLAPVAGLALLGLVLRRRRH